MKKILGAIAAVVIAFAAGALVAQTTVVTSFVAPLHISLGGTGTANSSGNLAWDGAVTFSGAHTFTGTITGDTNVTFPTSGTLATTSGAAVASVANSDGTLTISPTTGSVVASIALGHANTWSGVQTITSGDLALLGSSTGKTTLNSGLSSSGNNTLTLPITSSDTLAALGTAETFTASQTFGNTSGGPAIFTPGPLETDVALTGCNGSTATMDLFTGTYFHCTVSAGGVTFAVSNPGASGKVSSFTLELTNGGSQTLTWMSGTKWPGGAAPTFTTSGVDLVVCSTRDGATTWRCVGSEINSH